MKRIFFGRRGGDSVSTINDIVNSYEPVYERAGTRGDKPEYKFSTLSELQDFLQGKVMPVTMNTTPSELGSGFGFFIGVEGKDRKFTVGMTYGASSSRSGDSLSCKIVYSQGTILKDFFTQKMVKNERADFKSFKEISELMDNDALFVKYRMAAINLLRKKLSIYANFLDRVDIRRSKNPNMTFAVHYDSIKNIWVMEYNPNILLEFATYEYTMTNNFKSLEDAYIYVFAFILAHEMDHNIRLHTTETGKIMDRGISDNLTNTILDSFINLRLKKVFSNTLSSNPSSLSLGHVDDIMVGGGGSFKEFSTGRDLVESVNSVVKKYTGYDDVDLRGDWRSFRGEVLKGFVNSGTILRFVCNDLSIFNDNSIYFSNTTNGIIETLVGVKVKSLQQMVQEKKERDQWEKDQQDQQDSGQDQQDQQDPGQDGQPGDQQDGQSGDQQGSGQDGQSGDGDSEDSTDGDGDGQSGDQQGQDGDSEDSTDGDFGDSEDGDSTDGDFGDSEDGDGQPGDSDFGDSEDSTDGDSGDSDDRGSDGDQRSDYIGRKVRDKITGRTGVISDFDEDTEEVLITFYGDEDAFEGLVMSLVLNEDTVVRRDISDIEFLSDDQDQDSSSDGTDSGDSSSDGTDSGDSDSGYSDNPFDMGGQDSGDSGDNDQGGTGGQQDEEKIPTPAESLGDDLDDLIGGILDSMPDDTKDIIDSEEERNNQVEDEREQQRQEKKKKDSLKDELNKAAKKTKDELEKSGGEMDRDEEQLYTDLGLDKITKNLRPAKRSEWRKVLEAVLRKAFSFSISRDPNMFNKKLGEDAPPGFELDIRQVKSIVIALDCSASMGYEEFRMAFQHLVDMLSALPKAQKCEFFIVPWGGHSVEETRKNMTRIKGPNNLLTIVTKMKGDIGSTYVIPMWEVIRTIKKPDLILVLTDGSFTERGDLLSENEPWRAFVKRYRHRILYLLSGRYVEDIKKFDPTSEKRTLFYKKSGSR